MTSSSASTMTLAKKANRAMCTRFDLDTLDSLGVPIKRLVTDSRRVRPGDIFIAYPGEQHDGRDFISQAIDAGSNAVLWQRDRFRWNKNWQVPNLGIPKLRDCLGAIAAKTYGYPSEKLWVIGITGTNGKTSCSQWIADGLNHCGRKTALIGTLGHGFLEKLTPDANTTPDAVSLQSWLRKYLKQGAKCVTIEASSHGLAQARLNSIAFDAALLTNLTRDHLDYHGSTKRYQAEKAKLFRFPTLRHAVINLDDPFGVTLANTLKRKDLGVIGYGFRSRVALDRRLPRVCGKNLVANSDGLVFEVLSPWGNATLRSGLIGKFNASNLLGSLTTLLVSDVGLGDAVSALQRVQAPRGRMQCVGGGTQPLVVVDYAHTPDALEKVLMALRELLTVTPDRGVRKKVGDQRHKAKLICVFGCGGDRDRGKRPLMGAIATRLADELLITSDNPRSEDPLTIINDIAEGAKSNYHVVEDRAAAIYSALKSADKGDIVLIAGKGHEDYQEIMGSKLPFSDIDVVKTALARRKN